MAVTSNPGRRAAGRPNWFARRFPPRLPRVRSPKKRRPILGFLARLLGIAVIFAMLWALWVVHRINQVASEDQAQPADAIAVFGAAEYSGHPSPVYHARLDHAVALYQRQIAPLVITLGGGSDRDSGKTEGGVGRDYLLGQGVPFAAIVAETNSFSTAQQARRLSQIAGARGLHHLVVVSDATHLFRIKVLCAENGLMVYTSPRAPLGHIDDYDKGMRYLHEVLSYSALRMHLQDGWVHRWLDGRGDD